jgi:hypothetical protein
MESGRDLRPPAVGDSTAAGKLSIQYATAMNDNGQIAADAYDTVTYQTDALLLSPH